MVTIPEESVEAAALVMYRNDHYGQVTDWPTAEELSQGRSIFDPPPTLDEFKADYMRDVRSILEAAAPYIKADAWEEGHDAGFTYGAFQGRVQDSPNPYRSND